ncbi:AAA family ATPase [Mycobacterium sp. SMC-13]|uniref:AAA family ATPase n=1 Tax=Mycobacterium sp. SMC-13 TaxID=3381626 RepID=UPI0038764471
MTDAIDWYSSSRQAIIEWASDIQPERQVWLWKDRVPVGTASAWAGRGGTGKTTYAIHVAAQLSNGTLEGEYYGTPRRVLIWSGEDAWGAVLVPRLIAAGADLTMIGRLSIETTVDEETGEVTPRIPMDVGAIRAAIESSGAALVILDPISSTMSGDLHRESDVRAALDPLARLAESTKTVVMFVRHFGKGGGNASDKMSGSHAFRDAVRSVFLFAEDGDRVVVTQNKGNYAPGNESFAFRLESVSIPTVDGVAEVARVVELGVSESSVDDIINRPSERPGDDDPKDADAWLTRLLANTSMMSNEVYASADAAGLSKDKAKRAKKNIGAQAVRGRGDGPWWWTLPTKGADDQGSNPNSRDVAPLLPCTSEGVQYGPKPPREQSTDECSLAPQSTPSPASMPVRQFSKPVRNRRRTIGGKPASSYPTCTVCAEPVTCGQGSTHLSCSKQHEAAS